MTVELWIGWYGGSSELHQLDVLFQRPASLKLLARCTSPLVDTSDVKIIHRGSALYVAANAPFLCQDPWGGVCVCVCGWVRVVSAPACTCRPLISPIANDSGGRAKNCLLVRKGETWTWQSMYLFPHAQSERDNHLHAAQETA